MSDVEPTFDTLKAFAGVVNQCPALGNAAPHEQIAYPKEMIRGTTPQPCLYRVSCTKLGETLTYELHICKECGLVFALVEHSSHGV